MPSNGRPTPKGEQLADLIDAADRFHRRGEFAKATPLIARAAPLAEEMRNTGRLVSLVTVAGTPTWLLDMVEKERRAEAQRQRRKAQRAPRVVRVDAAAD